jgi:ribosome recycling factor
MTRQRHIPADPADELRELIREAHGACRDLSTLLREYRQARAELLTDVRATIQKAVDDELRDFYRQWQKEANHHTAQLNEAVTAARHHIINALALSKIRSDGDSLRIEFKGALFEDNNTPPSP